jgi:thiol-disulfide isomerase/thioredoxin
MASPALSPPILSPYSTGCAQPARRRALRLGLLLAGGLASGRSVHAAGDALLAPLDPAPLAPPFALRTLDGAPLAFEALLGRLLVVNFWATWCAPCVEELPSLERLQDALGARATVLLVNQQEGEPRIRQFLARLPIRLPIVRDTDGAVTRAWDAIFLPTTVVVDVRGRRRLLARGALDWTRPLVLRRLRTLADER